MAARVATRSDDSIPCAMFGIDVSLSQAPAIITRKGTTGRNLQMHGLGFTKTPGSAEPGEHSLTILESTFRHFRGISARRELELWRKGVTTWDQLRQHFSPQRSLFGDKNSRAPISRQIEESRDAFDKRDIAYFSRHLERREHFRIALSFPDQTLFLDIESTGLSRYYDHITEIGWSLGPEYGFFVMRSRLPAVIVENCFSQMSLNRARTLRLMDS